MMTVIKNRPYLILWLTIPVTLTISLINGPGKVFNLNMHDTYFVVATFYIGLMVSIFLAVLGGLYWISRNRRLLKGLTAFHVVTTILGPLLIVLTFWFYNSKITTIDPSQQFELSARIKLILTLTAALWIASQIAFLFNLTYGLTRKK